MRLPQWVSQLYRAGLDVSPEDHQRWSLERLCELVHFDAALWGMGNRERGRFHNVKVFGLPVEYAQALELTRELNPVFPSLVSSGGRAIDMAEFLPGDAFHASAVYRQCFSRYGIEAILTTCHADPRSGLFTLLSLYRRQAGARFSAEDRQLFETAAYHMVSAYSHAFFLHITRPRTPQAEQCSAIVDREGVLHEVQPEFLDLLERRFTPYRGRQLPFRFEPDRHEQRIEGLLLQVRPFADLYLVQLRELTPLDGLTDRERQVVLGVCQGLSHKALGRELGLASTTVSSHLYRAYGKLGVESRSALARLVRG